MKKIIALLVAMLMLVGLLAACNPAPDPTDPPAVVDPTDPPSADPTDPPTPQKNVDRYPLEGSPELTIGVKIENADTSRLFGLMEEATGIKATYQYVTNEQAPLLFSGDMLPDILWSSSYFGLSLSQINGYGEEGVIINFRDHLDKMPNLKRAIEENPDMLSAVLAPDGSSFYTIPYYMFTLTGVNNLIYYRTDHMAQTGWTTAPTNIDEFKQFLGDLKTTFGANDPDYIPFAPYQASHLAYNGQLSRALFPSFGDLMENDIIVDTDGKTIVAGFTTEQYQRYLKYVKSLMDEGLMDKDAFTAKGDISKPFQNEGHTSVSTLMVYLPDSIFASGKQEVSVMVPLATEYNADPAFALPNMAKMWGGMIKSDCANMDAALAWVDAFFSTEDDPLNDAGTIWGISFWLGEHGVEWEWKEKGESFYEYTPEGYSSRSVWSTEHGYACTPYIGRWEYIAYDENGNAGFKATSVRANLMPKAINIIRTSNLQLNQEESDIYNDCWSDIKTYLAQMNAAFITGEADIDADWAEYVNNLNAMGLPDVIEVYQAALDRYLAQ